MSSVPIAIVALAALFGANANRFRSLDEPPNPYWVSRTTARLTTPQWVGEPGVEAVLVLSVDDLKDPARHEAYLRPILERLKQLYGEAAVSLVATEPDAEHPQLQRWLQEGLSIEAHTLTHPCPCLQGGEQGLKAAKQTFNECVDLLWRIPGNRPVAFRMPCCDSMNSVSPRFYAEVFNHTTPHGHFLQADSSVFMVFTPNDPELPRRLVYDEPGRERFRKYVPSDRRMVNYVEDYPYPYVVGRLIWEIPVLMPSDWDGQNRCGKGSPKILEDWKAAVDAVVWKRGVLAFCFHPYDWIGNNQVVELIDYVHRTYGPRVKFLNFRQVVERLTKNALGGEPLRADDGGDNGVRVLDLNGDGFLDVVIGNQRTRTTRVWQPKTQSWQATEFPVPLVEVDDKGRRRETGVHFGVLQENGLASFLVWNERTAGLWHFDGRRWVRDERGLEGLDANGPVFTSRQGRDTGVRFHDVDGDGRSELLVGNPRQNAVFAWQPGTHTWKQLPFRLPPAVTVVDQQGRDAGFRLVDVDEDGCDDVVFSNADRYSLDLFVSLQHGWSRRVLSGQRSQGQNELPMIVRGDGTQNGVWFKYRHMWVQNEQTGKRLPNHVDERWYTEMLVKDTEPPPRSPQASLRAIQVIPGMQVELVAAEPLTMDPVDLAWGPDGKLWVVEMADYPLGLDGKGKIGGRVRFLEDLDGDGRYDTSTVFLEPLPYPTGILPWRKGVLITAAPNLLYAEDTDGDGKADRVQPLFTGFGEGNQQHRFNHPRWGLDNWVYLANGDSAGTIRSVKTGQVVDMGAQDLRVRPDEGLIETASGRTQFGRNRDDWGNWFGCNNSDPGWHYVLDTHYLKRNPFVVYPSVKADLTNRREVFPSGRVITHCFYEQPTPPEGQPGVWTSICGVTIYRDRLLGEQFAGNLFVSDSVYNCVHRMVLTPTGVTFSGRRAPGEERREFLSSSDPWFRPNTVETGPDGALWVCDMYRFVIEHPEWIDARLIDKLDLRAGHDKGRIYRIYPVGKRPRPIPRLDRLDTAGLVAALDSPNGWQRDMAHMMLLWRNDPASIPLLERTATSCSNPLARLHALCILDGLHALKASILLHALKDPHPGVRRQAVRLSEPLLKEDPQLAKQVLKLQDDPDPRVQLQLAYSLGQWHDERAARAVGRLAAEAADRGDPYTVAAALSSATHNLSAVVEEVIGEGPIKKTRADLVANLVSTAWGLKDERSLCLLFSALARPARPNQSGGVGYAAWQFRLLADVLDRLSRRGASFRKVYQQASRPLKQALEQCQAVFKAARATVADTEASLESRTAALRIIGRGLTDREKDLQTLAGLLNPSTAVDLQLVAVQTLGRLRDPSVPQLLLASWREQGPKVRSAVLDVLMSRVEWIHALLDAAAQRRDVLAGIGRFRRDLLMRHPNAEVRKWATELFGHPTTRAEIEAALKRFEPATRLKGDPVRGKKVFVEATCSKCHELGGVGEPLGADLRTLVDKSPQALLVAIIDPNRAVEDRYLQYTAVTVDGLVISGMLVEESGGSITLADSEGNLHTLLRQDIEQLVANNISSMPEGLQEKLTLQDMADLFAFIAESGPPPKQFPGNWPQWIKQQSDGRIRLTAETGAIYGPSLEFAQRPPMLTNWRSQQDRAEWSFTCLHGGVFDVAFDYACYSGEADKPFRLEVTGRTDDGRVVPTQTIHGTVASTGRWTRFDRKVFGRVRLPAGKFHLTLRSDGPIQGPMINLRAIELVPVPQQTTASAGKK